MSTAQRLIELLEVHDLHLAPIDALGDRARLQHHPDTATRKWELDEWFVERLESFDDVDVDDGDAATTIRAIAHIDLVPPVYEWLAEGRDGQRSARTGPHRAASHALARPRPAPRLAR